MTASSGFRRPAEVARLGDFVEETLLPARLLGLLALLASLGQQFETFAAGKGFAQPGLSVTDVGLGFVDSRLQPAIPLDGGTRVGRKGVAGPWRRLASRGAFRRDLDMQIAVLLTKTLGMPFRRGELTLLHVDAPAKNLDQRREGVGHQRTGDAAAITPSTSPVRMRSSRS